MADTASDPDDELPRNLVLLLTPAADIHRRVEPADFIAFVAAVVRLVDARFSQQPAGACVEVDAACGLLPGGGLVVEVQTRPGADSSPAADGVADAVRGLPVPGVVRGPVAFTRRGAYGDGPPPAGGFGLPFARHARGGMTLLDDILMGAGAVAAPRRSVWQRLGGVLSVGAAPRTIDQRAGHCPGAMPGGRHPGHRLQRPGGRRAVGRPPRPCTQRPDAEPLSWTPNFRQ